jgi:hypothetical protein
MNSFLENIKFITDNFGPRIAGSEGDRKTIEYLEKEFGKFTSNVETESFKVVGRSNQNYVNFVVWGYFISVICYFLLPPISLGILIMIPLVHYLAWIKQVNLLDMITRKKESRNIIAKFPAKKESRGVIIMSAHHDSSYQMPFLQKKVKSNILTLMGIFLGVLILLISSLWKTITMGFFSAGIIEIFNYSLGSLRIGWFVFPDIFFLLSLFNLGLAFYFRSGFVTKNEVMGANDNLSSVVLLLALAEYLQDNQLENWEVRLISFGAEEPLRSVGSYNYVRNHQEELKNSIVLNFDGIGYGNFIGISSGEQFVGVKHDKEFVKLIQRLAKKNEFEIPDYLGSFGWTDAGSFSRKNIKATTIFCYGGELNLWHSLEDKVENLQEESIQNVFKLSTALLNEFDNLEEI